MHTEEKYDYELNNIIYYMQDSDFDVLSFVNIDFDCVDIFIIFCAAVLYSHAIHDIIIQ